MPRKRRTQGAAFGRRRSPSERRPGEGTGIRLVAQRGAESLGTVFGRLSHVTRPWRSAR